MEKEQSLELHLLHGEEVVPTFMWSVNGRARHKSGLALLARVTGIAGAAYSARRDSGMDSARGGAGGRRSSGGDRGCKRPDPQRGRSSTRSTAASREQAPQLDALAARIDAALARSAGSGRLEDLRRELAVGAVPLSTWHTALEVGGASRVSAALDRLARAQATWSATLGRAEPAEADEAVARRKSARRSNCWETRRSLRAWRDRVLALDDRVLERRTAVTSALARLEERARSSARACWFPTARRSGGAGTRDAFAERAARVPERSRTASRAQSRDYLLSESAPADRAGALRRAARGRVPSSGPRPRRAPRCAGARRRDARAGAPDLDRDAAGVCSLHRGSSRWRRGASSRCWRCSR